MILLKKIGIAAVTYKDNFGSALQTYATQYAIEKLGYDPYIFDINSVQKLIMRKKKLFYFKRLICDPDEFIYVLRKALSLFKSKKSDNQYALDMKLRHQMYSDFNDKYLKMFERTDGWKSLSEQSSTCDRVVVGSDQIWRPSNIIGRFFTLKFVPDNIPKIAYASSFGVSVLPKSVKKESVSFLERFSHLSVREESGKKIVKDLINKDIPVVCDPTMLLTKEQWAEVSGDKPLYDEPYILCYFLGQNSMHREFAQNLRKTTGCKIIALLHGGEGYVAKDEDYPDYKPYDIGPAEFVNLIKNAAYICTDSFHGTVFSILHSKKFFSFRRYEDTSETSTNDRLYTLLNWTGLSDRMLYGNEDVNKCMEMDVDYDDVLSKVDAKRNESMSYLVNALEE